MKDYHWDELREELGDEQFRFLEFVSYLWMREARFDARNDVYRELFKALQMQQYQKVEDFKRDINR